MSNSNRLSWDDEHPSNYEFKKTDVKQFLPKSNYDKVKEQIASTLYKRGCLVSMDDAEAVLRISGILIKADNQDYNHLLLPNDFSRETAQAMIADGWVKTEKRQDENEI